MKILKTKWYPVDLDKKLIYNDPKNRMMDCDLGSRCYHGMNTIGIAGRRSLEYHTRYKDFQETPALNEPSPAYLAWQANGFQAVEEANGTANLDAVRALLDSISVPLYLLSDFEREFLSRLLDHPLAAEFEEHLKPDSAAAFGRFKQMGFVELAAISERWRITNDGRKALGLPKDPQID